MGKLSDGTAELMPIVTDLPPMEVVLGQAPTQPGKITNALGVTAVTEQHLEALWCVTTQNMNASHLVELAVATVEKADNVTPIYAKISTARQQAIHCLGQSLLDLFFSWL